MYLLEVLELLILPKEGMNVRTIVRHDRWPRLICQACLVLLAQNDNEHVSSTICQSELATASMLIWTVSVRPLLERHFSAQSLPSTKLDINI